ncbi:MAG: trehalose-6-phosphate synthase, partial [Deltaproteobacteria bacterium]|nr:trehalose-6-phosphate synthase [Deltaproteobacteria bacterium]
MGRLIIVSNRLPLTTSVVDGTVAVTRSAGGLATGLSGPHERLGGLWLGWPGDISELSDAQRAEFEHRLAERHAVPLYLSREEIASYYEGFAN